jgi:hypothetical protein
VANAVSGITNAAYHVLGSFTPVIIKITVVAASLIAYNRELGLVYLACLIVPALMTIYFNNWLRVLRDAQYSVVSQAEGVGTMTLLAKDKGVAQARFRELMRARTDVLIALVSKHQISLYVRHAVLISGQFLIVFLALAWRERIGLTPGDFTKIIGYTTQVAASFLEAAACLDAIVSYSRAYHVYVQGQGKS